MLKGSILGSPNIMQLRTQRKILMIKCACVICVCVNMEECPPPVAMPSLHWHASSRERIRLVFLLSPMIPGEWWNSSKRTRGGLCCLLVSTPQIWFVWDEGYTDSCETHLCRLTAREIIYLFPLFVSLLLLPRVSSVKRQWKTSCPYWLGCFDIWPQLFADSLSTPPPPFHSLLEQQQQPAHAAFPFTFLVRLNWHAQTHTPLFSFLSSLQAPLPISNHLHCRSIVQPRCPTLLAPGVTKWHSCWRLRHPGAATQTRTCLLT